MAYNSQQHLSTGIDPLEVIIPRSAPIMSIRNLPAGQTLTSRPRFRYGTALATKRTMMAPLPNAIPKVAEARGMNLQRSKGNKDETASPCNADVQVGDHISTVAHSKLHKLDSPVLGLYLVLDKDDKTFFIHVNDEEERISCDRATRAIRPEGDGPSIPSPNALVRDRVNATSRTMTDDEYLIDRLTGLREADDDYQAKVR